MYILCLKQDQIYIYNLNQFDFRITFDFRVIKFLYQ